MILWNLGSWYDVANCCNNCFGYGMNSSTVSDCNWLRAVTMFKDTAPRRPRQYHVLPALASSFFAWFFSAETHVPLVFLLFIFRSAQEVHTAWVALRCILVFLLMISFSFFFNMQLCRRELLCFEEEGLLDTGQFLARAIVQWPALWSHYDNVHWLHRSSRSSSSHTWRISIYIYYNNYNTYYACV